MKKSQFNHFLKENDRIICFNALSGKLFSVNDIEYRRIEEVLEGSDLTEENQELKRWLEANCFIVDDGVDEIDTIRLKNREIVFDNTYEMVVNPTIECNFSCWYCYQSHTIGHMSPETLENIKKYVKRLVDQHKIKGFKLSWFGGEPLLYFEKVVYPLSLYIRDLMKEHNLPFYNAITTNGYLINQDIVQKFAEINLKTFQITLDGDEESHNRTRNHKQIPSFHTIIQNITDICESDLGSRILLRINYTDEIIQKDFSQILHVLPENIRSQIRVNFQRVWQTQGVDKSKKENTYLLKAIHDLREMGFNINISTYNIKANQMCYADRYYFSHINYDGKVYKCTARDYLPQNQVGELTSSGEIRWKPGVLEKRYLKPNFDNGACLKCKKLFLCTGLCSQKRVEVEAEVEGICIAHAHEMEPDTYIREQYRGRLAARKNEST